MSNTQNDNLKQDQDGGVHRLDRVKTLNYYNEKSDFDVWGAFKLGNEDAFNFIYREYMPALYNYAYQKTKDRDIAREVIQTMFIKIRGKRNKLPNVQNIKAYLMKIMYRLVLDEYEKRKRRPEVIAFSQDSHFPIELSAETKMINFEITNERKEKLETALNLLSTRQKEAVLLKYHENLSYKEIADVMGLEHVKSARKLIYRAVSSLKDFFHV
ncbi:RNA polymerase sigma factor [Belliella marina]|uniref:RNA polymerase sigma factor n=1 Tax=Belliella marina TaxID=1644146 RepID=A0ABW4VLI2_9BACT